VKRIHELRRVCDDEKKTRGEILGEDDDPNITNKFITYEYWQRHTKKYFNAIAIPIKSVEEDQDALVGCFTTLNPNHVFISNKTATRQCGLIKALAITAKVSAKRNENLITERIYDDYHTTNSSLNSTYVCINSKPLGWCNGPELYKKMVDMKRSGKIDEDVAIVLDPADNTLYISCDSGRPIRPLLVVNENGDAVIEAKNMWGRSFDELLASGCVEYIDAWEQHYILLAYDLGVLRERKSEIEKAKKALEEAKQDRDIFVQTNKGSIIPPQILDTLAASESVLTKLLKKRPYSHCELDPSAILGISASIIPFPNYDQGPRVTFQASMGKQACGIYLSTHSLRMDSSSKLLCFPNRPLFEPQMNHILGITDLPQGQMATIAFCPYTQHTMEDGIIMNKGSIDNGLLRLIKYMVYRTTQETGEQFGMPPHLQDSKKIFSHINQDGTPKIGAYLQQGDCVIGKFRTEPGGRVVNTSLYIDFSEEGVVDQVLVDTDSSLSKSIKVKLRTTRLPIEGDKFSPTHAQKGTVTLILGAHDMPFVLEGPNAGMRPDMIVDPHSIPSRMTMGYMFELFGGRAAALLGERINATAFRPFDYDDFAQIMRHYGYNDRGEEVMASGFTGKPMASRIFIGPAYVQALRHHVLDKIQVRGQGQLVRALTRAPPGGRALGKSGLKLGEMERDAMLSYGAAFFMNERLCLASDAYKVQICKTCKIIPSLAESNTCHVCRESKNIFTVTMPYANKLFMQFLAGMGLRLGNDVAVKEDQAFPQREIIDQKEIIVASLSELGIYEPVPEEKEEPQPVATGFIQSR